MYVKYLLSILLLLGSSSLWATPNVIGVSILPQKYFVERIGGANVEVQVMVGDGYNPATYEPKPKQLSRLSKAKVYFLAGVPFEQKWVNVFRKVNPAMKQVSLISNITMREYNSTDHAHQDGSGLHDSYDPHFWLNPLLVKIAAGIIRDTLSQENPERSSEYDKNYQAFIKDLDGLDQLIRQQVSNARQTNFAVFHPSWGYFADAYGLRQIAIEVQNRQSGARTLNMTINTIKKLAIKTIFVQKQFSETDALMIARETGARVITVDPLAENYIENMKNVSKLFMEALK